MSKCRDIIAELNVAMSADGSPSPPPQVEKITRENPNSRRQQITQPFQQPRIEDDGEEEVEEDREDGNYNDMQEQMRTGILKSYMEEMETRVLRGEEEKLKLMEENHQLKLKMKELLTLQTEGLKGRDAKVKEQLESLVKAAQGLEKENISLKEELKTLLQERIQTAQTVEKYDKVVEQLKTYNEQLLDALKESEVEREKLQNQGGFSEEEIKGIRNDIEKYQKKFEQMESLNKTLEDERKKSLGNYQEVTQENEVLKSKLLSLTQDMDNIKTNVMKSFEEEASAKEKIKELLDAMQAQLRKTQGQLEEKEKENLQLMIILNELKQRDQLSSRAPKDHSNGRPIDDETDEDEDENFRKALRGSDAGSGLNLRSSNREAGRNNVQRNSGYNHQNDTDDDSEEEEPFDNRRNHNQALKTKKRKHVAKPKDKLRRNYDDESDDERIMQPKISKEKRIGSDQAINKPKRKDVGAKSKPPHHQEEPYDQKPSKRNKNTAGETMKKELKSAIALKALNSIQKSKNAINSLQSSEIFPKHSLASMPSRNRQKHSHYDSESREAEHKAVKSRRSKEWESDKNHERGGELTNKEKALLKNKMEMIGEVNKVLRNLEGKIRSMKSEMNSISK